MRNRKRVKWIFLVMFFGTIALSWPLLGIFHGAGPIQLISTDTPFFAGSFVIVLVSGMLLGTFLAMRAVPSALSIESSFVIARSFIYEHTFVLAIGLLAMRVGPGLSFPVSKGHVFATTFFFGMFAFAAGIRLFRHRTIGLALGIIFSILFGFYIGYAVEPARSLSGFGILFFYVVGMFLRDIISMIVSILDKFLGAGRSNLGQCRSTGNGILQPKRFFGGAIGSFLVLYLLIIAIFSLWFYAIYLEGSHNVSEQSISRNRFYYFAESIPVLSWWDCFYFSFVTVTTLGYGDIYPIQWMPQVLVVAETLIGIALVVGYFGVILHVVGIGSENKATTEFADKQQGMLIEQLQQENKCLKARLQEKEEQTERHK